MNKRKVLIVCLVVLMISCSMLLAACTQGAGKNSNHTYFAMVKLADGEVIEGPCSNYRILTNDLIKVTIAGATYITHATNVVIIDG